MDNKLKILDDITVNVKVIDNEYGFKLQDLFLMAARKNPKRVFLFVSTVLGKHIPVNPKKSILVGRLLANKIDDGNMETEVIVQALKDNNFIEQAWEYSKENKISSQKSTLFIGFAETATALGNSVFSAFQGSNIRYVHTTRDFLKECKSVFSFDEEHSHAVEHFCYPLEEDILQKYQRIVLIDDEITTGNTALNLIKAINEKYEGKEYVVVSILDWRTQNWVDKFKATEKELDIKIQPISLIKGEVNCENNYLKEHMIDFQNSNQVENDNEFNDIEELEHKIDLQHKGMKFTRVLGGGEEVEYDYSIYTGRFGLKDKEANLVEEYLEEAVKGMGPFENEILVLGTEEFMYLPMMLAAKISNAKYQSTTRSPIYPQVEAEYGIKCASKFKSPFDASVINYLYNVDIAMYKEILFVTERKLSEKSKEEMLRLFKRLKINKVRFVYF